MNCGRETGGQNVDTLGACPVSQSIRYDGVNGGNFAGRFCWFLAGTFCNGEIQGTFANKIGDCLMCPFFLEVERQEAQNLIFIKEDIDLLKRGGGNDHYPDIL
jgi:hypothetical protein